MTGQQFTSQVLAKLKAADSDDVISVRVEQIAELIEQKERLIEQNKQLLAKDVRSEEEKAEYRSKIAVLEQLISDLERSKKLNNSNSNSSMHGSDTSSISMRLTPVCQWFAFSLPHLCMTARSQSRWLK